MMNNGGPQIIPASGVSKTYVDSKVLEAAAPTDAEILTAVESESGRDMSVDGDKLDGIEAGATADQDLSGLAANGANADITSLTALDDNGIPHAAVANLQGNKNLIINGTFDVWQRGTSVVTTANGFGYYTADMWATYREATVTQEFEVIGSKRGPSMKVALAGSATEIFFYTKIEDGNSLHGEVVTCSFWAKGDSAESVAFVARYYDDATEDNEEEVESTTFDLTTSWTKHTITFTAMDSTTANKRNLFLRFNKANYGGTYIQIAQVQLELGSVATDFEYRDYGTELAMCQRYYEKDGGTLGSYTFKDVGEVTIANYYSPQIQFKQSKRVAPTVTLTDDGGAVNFGTAGAAQADIYGFREYREATGTGIGRFASSWTASAEL